MSIMKTHINDVDDDEKWQRIDVKMGKLAKKKQEKMMMRQGGHQGGKLKTFGVPFLIWFFIFIFLGDMGVN